MNKFDEKIVDLGPVDFIFQTCYKVRNDMKKKIQTFNFATTQKTFLVGKIAHRGEG